MILGVRSDRFQQDVIVGNCQILVEPDRFHAALDLIRFRL
jgi:hypothetical protein